MYQVSKLGTTAGITSGGWGMETIRLSTEDENKIFKLAKREMFKKWEVLRLCSAILEEQDGRWEWLGRRDFEFVNGYED